MDADTPGIAPKITPTMVPTKIYKNVTGANTTLQACVINDNIFPSPFYFPIERSRLSTESAKFRKNGMVPLGIWIPMPL